VEEGTNKAFRYHILIKTYPKKYPRLDFTSLELFCKHYACTTSYTLYSKQVREV